MKLGVRGTGAGVTVNEVNWERDAACGGGKNFMAVPVSSFDLSGSAQVDGTILSATQVANSQAGAAYASIGREECQAAHAGWCSDDSGGSSAHAVEDTDRITVQFEFYCGDGSGADGLCMNFGGNNLGGRVGEDGITEGVAVCWDEWSNGGDHGAMI